MKLNFRQLEAFHTILQTGTVSLAAESLHVTQPAVSAQLAKLEDQLGVELFERKKGRLIPTPEAMYMQHEVRSIFESLNNLSHTVRNVQSQSVGHLTVVSMPGPSLFLVPDLIAKFASDKPGLQANIHTLPSHEVREWVRAEKHDIGLAEITSGDTDLNADAVDLECVCALPWDHPLASKSVIEAKDLDGEPMVTLNSIHPVFVMLKRIFDTQELELNIRFKTQVFLSALTFVEQHMAIAIIDPTSAAAFQHYRRSEKVIFKPFKPAIQYRIAVLYPQQRPASAITKQFGKLLKAELERLNEISSYSNQ